ncbi:hypothetical protein PsorP6_009253 [Peronosclerospora sorghi]|uniref:Uncharacterized protein n=1 Tax=Peronosclerospora sorghi TaxID=230839 RepID=A0ACC0W0Q8_9STRA|nr:hypothetical protein PsorP6_009253 [Peronosclerospora sorghi]
MNQLQQREFLRLRFENTCRRITTCSSDRDGHFWVPMQQFSCSSSLNHLKRRMKLSFVCDVAWRSL